jgi:predicted enzyme related to lactoylglutathione lyase
MATDAPAQATAWIAVSPDTDPMVEAHIEHAGQVVGETHRGDDWRQALAWARARTDRVFIRFDHAETTWWAGAGPPPGDPPPPALPERPTVFVDEWIAELQSLRRRVAELEAAGHGTELAWTMWTRPRDGAVRQVRVGAGELHRVAAFWAAATGGTVERAGVLGRMVDWALAAQAGVHPELLVSSREPPGRVTLTVEVDDLEARLRWLRDLGAKVLQETAGVALVEDPEGNRALLVRRRPDEPVRFSPARRPRS